MCITVALCYIFCMDTDEKREDTISSAESKEFFYLCFKCLYKDNKCVFADLIQFISLNIWDFLILILEYEA